MRIPYKGDWRPSCVTLLLLRYSRISTTQNVMIPNRNPTRFMPDKPILQNGVKESRINFKTKDELTDEHEQQMNFKGETRCIALRTYLRSGILVRKPLTCLFISNAINVTNRQGNCKQILKQPWSRILFRFLIPVVFYANEGGWVRQNTTVIGSYLLVRRWRHVSAIFRS